MIVCREEAAATREACALLNDANTALCTRLERDFLRTLMGGCSTPISALAEIQNNTLLFRGNIFSLDGKQMMETQAELPADTAPEILANTGNKAALELLGKGADKIVEAIRHAGN